MSLNGPTHNAQEYTSLVQLKLQQMGSRLRAAVMAGSHVGKAAVAVEQVGAVTVRKRGSRHADTPIIDTPADKRWVFPTDYEWGDMVDRLDRVRMIVDPTGAYVSNGSNALGRAMDAEIAAAFFGTAKTGENGTDTTAFPAAQVVAVDVGGTAATGLNIKKLKVARRILMENEVDVVNDRLYCAVTARQHENLLNEIQVTSQDFNSQPVLVDGMISRFLGFDFVHTELLGVDGNDYYRVAAWAHSGMHLGIFDEIDAQVYPRPDKSNNIQVLVQGTFGATRLEEGKVVEIKCDES
jgi:hypothetical protein